MAGRVLRILGLTAALFPVVATIGAPDFDGLARAVSTVFRDNQPQSPASQVVFPTQRQVSPSFASVSPIA